MGNLAKVLTGFAAVAFVLALVGHFMGPIVTVSSLGYSRVCADLALLAIALVLTFPDTARASRPAGQS